MDAFNKNGSEYIQNLINEGVKNGTRTATVTGKWEITKAVLIPSDFTVILDSCHLRMGDNTFDNIFRNEGAGNLVTLTAGEGNSNIKILGKGEAILDGGNYNGLSEKNASREGRPHMYVNNFVLFVNVDNFEVKNIHCRYNRWWALDFIYCSNGHVCDIDFLSDDRAMDQCGNIYHGLIRERKEEVIVKQADGIDLRHGCHDIIIENITGFIEDDTVALTGLIGKTGFIPFKTESKPLDICNVQIKNIKTASFCSNVRLLSQGGVPLHDVLIDGVYDMSENSPHMDRGGYGVRVGDGDEMFGCRHATEDETYNITIRNVRSRALRAAIHLGGKMKNVTLENIEPFDGTKYIIDKRNEA